MSDHKRRPDEPDNPFEPSIEKAFGPPADCAVGYGRPPKATQFKKGQSGNPKGRPKRNGAISGKVGDILRALINLPTSIREGDKVRQIPLLKAVIRAFVATATHGDLSAVKTLLAELALLDPSPENRPAGYIVFNRSCLTREEFNARHDIRAGRERTFEEARAYQLEIGQEPAPIEVTITGQEKEPLLIKIPEHLRPKS